MLMNADDGCVDHVDSSCIMGDGKCIYEAAPDACPAASKEAIVASGVG